MKVTSRFGPGKGGSREEALRLIDRGCRWGLEAKALVVYNAWKQQMMLHHRGFTTGAFAHGIALNAITRGPLTPLGPRGAYSMQVGTNKRYHLFWELGHMNTFTRRYERVPTLAPASEDTVVEQEAAFVRQFKRSVEGT